MSEIRTKYIWLDCLFEMEWNNLRKPRRKQVSNFPCAWLHGAFQTSSFLSPHFPALYVSLYKVPWLNFGTAYPENVWSSPHLSFHPLIPRVKLLAVTTKQRKGSLVPCLRLVPSLYTIIHYFLSTDSEHHSPRNNNLHYY